MKAAVRPQPRFAQPNHRHEKYTADNYRCNAEGGSLSEARGGAGAFARPPLTLILDFARDREGTTFQEPATRITPDTPRGREGRDFSRAEKHRKITPASAAEGMPLATQSCHFQPAPARGETCCLFADGPPLRILSREGILTAKPR
jgi:hypothetical protein